MGGFFCLFVFIGEGGVEAGRLFSLGAIHAEQLRLLCRCILRGHWCLLKMQRSCSGSLLWGAAAFQCGASSKWADQQQSVQTPAASCLMAVVYEPRLYIAYTAGGGCYSRWCVSPRKAGAAQAMRSAGEPLAVLPNQEPGMDMSKCWGQLGAVRRASCRLPSWAAPNLDCTRTGTEIMCKEQ